MRCLLFSRRLSFSFFLTSNLSGRELGTWDLGVCQNWAWETKTCDLGTSGLLTCFSTERSIYYYHKKPEKTCQKT